MENRRGARAVFLGLGLAALVASAAASEDCLVREGTDRQGECEAASALQVPRQTALVGLEAGLSAAPPNQEIVRTTQRWKTDTILRVDTPRSMCQVPGVRIWLSRKALRYFGTAIVPQILARMGDAKVLDKHGEMSGFKYSLTNFLVHNVSVEEIDYDFVPGHGLSITVRGITAVMVANYSVSGTDWYNPVWSDGQVFMPLGSGTEMNAVVKLSVVNGKPKVDLDTLTTRVELAEFYTEHSKAHQLAWIAGKFFREQIAEKIADGMRKDMQENVDVDLANLLDSLSPWFDIPLPLPVDAWAVNVILCSLDVGPDYVSADLHMEVVDNSKPWLAYQGKPDLLPARPPAMFEARMLTVSMTDWAFSGGLYLFGRGGLMNHTMPPEDMREWWYGRQYNITINFWAPTASVPSIDFEEGEVASSIGIAFAVRAVDRLTGLTIASVTADIPLKLTWNVTVEGSDQQTAKVGVAFISASPLQNFHGTIPQYFIEKAVNKALTKDVMPKLHALLDKGFPIPATAGVALHGTSLRITPAAAAFFTDVAWDPTSWLTFLHGRTQASELMRMARSVHQNDRAGPIDR